jgi:hypothetical protein
VREKLTLATSSVVIDLSEDCCWVAIVDDRTDGDGIGVGIVKEMLQERSGTANQNKKETHQSRLQKHNITRNTWLRTCYIKTRIE